MPPFARSRDGGRRGPVQFHLGLRPARDYAWGMTITLPDLPGLRDIAEGDILLDLACGAYAAGRLSRQLAAEVAGVSRHAFDEALYQRRISTYSEEMLQQDLETLRSIGSR